MATRDEMIRELEQEVARYQQRGPGEGLNSEEEDWARSAELALSRLTSQAPTEDDETAARKLLDRLEGFAEN